MTFGVFPPSSSCPKPFQCFGFRCRESIVEVACLVSLQHESLTLQTCSCTVLINKCSNWYPSSPRDACWDTSESKVHFICKSIHVPWKISKLPWESSSDSRFFVITGTNEAFCSAISVELQSEGKKHMDCDKVYSIVRNIPAQEHGQLPYNRMQILRSSIQFLFGSNSGNLPHRHGSDSGSWASTSSGRVRKLRSAYRRYRDSDCSLSSTQATILERQGVSGCNSVPLRSSRRLLKRLKIS